MIQDQNIDCVLNIITVCDISDGGIDREGSGGAELRLCC